MWPDCAESLPVRRRDLKTSNVLLTKEHVAKISDVGLACIQSGSDNTYEFAQGTFSYAAPEVILGDKCTEAVRCTRILAGSDLI